MPLYARIKDENYKWSLWQVLHEKTFWNLKRTCFISNAAQAVSIAFTSMALCGGMLRVTPFLFPIPRHVFDLIPCIHLAWLSQYVNTQRQILNKDISKRHYLPNNILKNKKSQCTMDLTCLRVSKHMDTTLHVEICKLTYVFYCWALHLNPTPDLSPWQCLKTLISRSMRLPLHQYAFCTWSITSLYYCMLLSHLPCMHASKKHTPIYILL